MIDRALLICLAATLSGHLCHAQTFDRVGRTEVLPAEPEPDWALIGAGLVDVGDDEFLGIVGVSPGLVGNAFTFSRNRQRLFTVETFYARGNRGERTDAVTILDTSTLAVTDEVVVPPKRALMASLDGALALSDDGRFLAVFNLTPGSSISVVDVVDREFAGEISTPGCSLVYPAGQRRYVMLCANGGLLTVTLDSSGNELSKVRKERFFDAQADPVTEAAARYGDEWLFVSFDGVVHPLDVSSDEPRFGDTWSLLTEADRADGWRIAGNQHLAVDEESGRLYSLVRQSEEPLDDPGVVDGTEIWVYDLAAQTRIARWDALPDGIGGEDGGGGGAIGATSGDGVSGIAVTRGEEPLLVAVGGGGISVRDAMSGDYVHERLENAPASGYVTMH